MKSKILLLMSAMIVVLTVCLVSPSISVALPPSGDYPYKTTYVPLGSGVPGLLYQPTVATPTSHIGVFVTHFTNDYFRFIGVTELAKRGYTVLAANNSSTKSGFTGDTDMDKILVEAGYGVKYLKTQVPGVTNVVLLGHSGGGVVMSSYQTIAENGVSVCQGPEKIVPCPDTLKGLVPADGVMLLDSNLGIPEMFLFSLDPAVVSDQNAQVVNPNLDLFNPKNGFNPTGSSDYSEKFIRKYLTKSGQRNNQLIDYALDRLALINEGKGRFSDDEPLIIAGGNYRGADNRLFSEDIQLWHHTNDPHPLLKADGTVTAPQIIYSVRVPANFTNLSPSLWNGALTTTVRRFLSTFAVRTTPDYYFDASNIYGVDWDSSYSSPFWAVKGIHKPLLVMGMTGHWEFMSAEYLYNYAASSDKTVIYNEGASHGFTACGPCGFTGVDTVTPMFNYIDKWLSDRF